METIVYIFPQVGRYNIRMVQITQTSSKPHKALTDLHPVTHACSWRGHIRSTPGLNKEAEMRLSPQRCYVESQGPSPSLALDGNLVAKPHFLLCLSHVHIFPSPSLHLKDLFLWWCLTPTSTGGNFQVPGPLFKEFPTCTRHHLDRLPSYPLTARTNLEVEKLQKN